MVATKLQKGHKQSIDLTRPRRRSSASLFSEGFLITIAVSSDPDEASPSPIVLELKESTK